MKQYIKPMTDVHNITVKSSMMDISKVGVTNEQQENVQGTTKIREVWSDGYWN